MSDSRLKLFLWVAVSLLGLCLIVYGVSGCIEGESGQAYLDPAVAEQIESAAEGGVSIMTILSSLLPWLIPFATGGGGLLAMWKRLKPKLTNAERQNDNLAWGGELLAEALDGVKDEFPETWAKVGPGIHRALKSSLALENAIREFRHLVPKE